MKNLRLGSISLVAAGSAATAGLFLLTSMQGTLTSERIFTLTAEQAEILSHMSIVYLDDGTGALVNKTIDLTSVNLRILNGLDATNGYPAHSDSIDPLETQTNGVGNLIVGYNEWAIDRTGSHNIVFGYGNAYSSFGGIVGPRSSTISGPFASVTGGIGNTASGYFTSVSGGGGNVASGGGHSCGVAGCSLLAGGSVSGGIGNTASGEHSSVSGGGTTRPAAPVVRSAAGRSTLPVGTSQSVSGGRSNMTIGAWSSISGGRNNTTNSYSDGSSISGGRSNMTIGVCPRSAAGETIRPPTTPTPPRLVAGAITRPVATTPMAPRSAAGQIATAPGDEDWAAGTYFSDD